MGIGAIEPVAAQDADVFRGHPGFRGAIEAHAAANLARFQALTVIERWMVDDVGRASLSSAAWLLAALGQLTPAVLVGSRPVASGQVSRGRVRLYLDRALANDLIAPIEPTAALTRETPLAPTPRFQAVMTGILRVGLEAAARLAPEVAPALGRLGDPGFVHTVSLGVARMHLTTPGLFPLERPMRLFHDSNGGVGILGALIARQQPDRAQLLDACEASHSALARAGHCSRIHVMRLLDAAERQGLLSRDGRTIHAAPALSDDVESYFASLFFVLRHAAVAALAAP